MNDFEAINFKSKQRKLEQSGAIKRIESIEFSLQSQPAGLGWRGALKWFCFQFVALAPLTPNPARQAG